MLARIGEVTFDAGEDFVQPVGGVGQHPDQRAERREVIVLEVFAVLVFPMLLGQLPRLQQFDVSLVELGAVVGEIRDSHGVTRR